MRHSFVFTEWNHEQQEAADDPMPMQDHVAPAHDEDANEEDVGKIRVHVFSFPAFCLFHSSDEALAFALRMAFTRGSVALGRGVFLGGIPFLRVVGKTG